MTGRRGGRWSVRPVTAGTWRDLERLFGARGAPHYCWCTIYRVPREPHLSNPEKKEAMRRLVGEGVPVGVLAYDGEEPVGWCSVAPRETYRRLDRSRTMPRATPPETPTWTILCFFVPGPHRGTGIPRRLLEGAVAYARSQGARVIEAYPFDTAGISATHRGHSSTFRDAGFLQDGARWYLDLEQVVSPGSTAQKSQKPGSSAGTNGFATDEGTSKYIT
ncbi:MAG TPA: GNAT family N-acetyltransferase [Actinomycetota bacterium]|nr:GNAT family N-acetyltransferase [Actinomycetota bacterium]